MVLPPGCHEGILIRLDDADGSSDIRSSHPFRVNDERCCLIITERNLGLEPRSGHVHKRRFMVVGIDDESKPALAMNGRHRITITHPDGIFQEENPGLGR